MNVSQPVQKIESEFTKWLKVGINLAPILYQSNRMNEGHWTGDGVIIPALATTALMPVYNPDGTWSSQAEYAVAGRWSEWGFPMLLL